MSLKKLIIAAAVASLLTACGNTATQPPLSAGEDQGAYMEPAYDSAYGSEPGADYGAPMEVQEPMADSSATAPVGATEAQAPEQKGFALHGVVTDQTTGKPVAGAKVSIGSQTLLSNAEGVVDFTEIMDTQVWVDVTKEGYDPVSRANVAFTKDSPKADKAFKLAPVAVSTPASPTPSEPKLSHEATIGADKFKSVSAMVVSGNTAYVLGMTSGFHLFGLGATAVVAYDVRTGEMLRSFRKTGLLSVLSKKVNTMTFENNEVRVSDGKTAYVYSPAGQFLRKMSAASYTAVKKAHDETNKVDYELTAANKIQVKTSSDTKTYTLDEVGAGQSLGLADDGSVVILDTESNALQQFRYTKGN